MVRRRYGLNLRMMTVARHDEELWEVDPENCCSAVKVGQLDRALAGKAAWMSGLRRDEADDPGDGADRRPRPARPGQGQPASPRGPTPTSHGYIADHDVPVNPLLDQGYPSIGCMPCTQPARPPSDPRSGRWAGQDKTECGLHLA